MYVILSSDNWRNCLLLFTTSPVLEFAFSALTLLVGRQEEHPVCKNRMMRCWCSYLSGARCRLFAYGQDDATASKNLIISCLISIQTGFTYVVPACPGCPETRPSNGCSSYLCWTLLRSCIWNCSPAGSAGVALGRASASSSVVKVALVLSPPAVDRLPSVSRPLPYWSSMIGCRSEPLRWPAAAAGPPPDDDRRAAVRRTNDDILPVTYQSINQSTYTSTCSQVGSVA